MSDARLPTAATSMLDAPPPSGPLGAAVAALKPVRTRRPARAFLAVTFVSLLFPLYSDLTDGLRQDLAGLPRGWLVLVGALWVAAFFLALGRALLPARGQVLADAARAGRTAVFVALSALVVSALFTPEATQQALVPGPGLAGFLVPWAHCVGWGVQVSGVLVAAGLLAVRRMLLVGAWQIGAALGAAGGALAGLDLHFGCAYAGTLHVALAHSGGVIICAALGAAVGSLVGRMSLR